MMIRVLTKKELHRAKSLAQEYLGADLGRFSVMFEAYPELFIGCFISEELIGVAYGYPYFTVRPKEAHKVLLQGLAIRWDYARAGRGSKLLQFFEDQVVKLGFSVVTLGSAEGYVERFYLKNNYEPVSYRICIRGDWDNIHEQASDYSILQIMREGERTIVYVPPRGGYNLAEKEAVRTFFGADEVNYIFEKQLQ